LIEEVDDTTWAWRSAILHRTLEQSLSFTQTIFTILYTNTKLCMRIGATWFNNVTPSSTARLDTEKITGKCRKGQRASGTLFHKLT
jgi:hypothetical protein